MDVCTRLLARPSALECVELTEVRALWCPYCARVDVLREGALIEGRLFVGDCYGSPFEGIPVSGLEEAERLVRAARELVHDEYPLHERDIERVWAAQECTCGPSADPCPRHDTLDRAAVGRALRRVMGGKRRHPSDCD